MSNSIYYASQALGYYYAIQRVRGEYEVSATSTQDQQLANLTSLTQQNSETCMYRLQPTPPMDYYQTHGFYQPMQDHPQQPASSIHYDYTPKFYQPQPYELPPPPHQAIPISQGPSLEDLVTIPRNFQSIPSKFENSNEPNG